MAFFLDILDSVFFCVVTVKWMYVYVCFLLSYHSDNHEEPRWNFLLRLLGLNVAYFFFVGFVYGDFRLGLSTVLLSIGSALVAPAGIAVIFGVVNLLHSLIVRDCPGPLDCLWDLLGTFLLWIPVGIWIGIYEGFRLVGWTVDLRSFL